MRMQPDSPSRGAAPSSRQLVVPRLPSLPSPVRAPYSFPVDIYHGAILGDFAPEVRLPGAIVHALLGYVPLVGSIIALRDVIADWLDADWLGVFLNSLAIFPVLGGVPKTLAVIIGFFRVQRYLRRSAKRSASGMTPQEVTHKRMLRLRALGISLLMPVAGFLYSLATLFAVQFAQTHWSGALGISFTSNLSLILIGVVTLIGCILGEIICIRTRAWLGLLLLPLALLFGLLPVLFL